MIVFPEGIVDVIPELNAMMNGNLDPINQVLHSIGAEPLSMASVSEDSHGNPNLSTMDTERILINAIYAHLAHHYSYSSVQLDVSLLDIPVVRKIQPPLIQPMHCC